MPASTRGHTRRLSGLWCLPNGGFTRDALPYMPLPVILLTLAADRPGAPACATGASGVRLMACSLLYGWWRAERDALRHHVVPCRGKGGIARHGYGSFPIVLVLRPECFRDWDMPAGRAPAAVRSQGIRGCTPGRKRGNDPMDCRFRCPLRPVPPAYRHSVSSAPRGQGDLAHIRRRGLPDNAIRHSAAG